MKKLLLAAGVGAALLGLSGQALALCAAPSTQVNDPALTTLLSGKTVCVAKAGGGWENQEYHQPGGALFDYKKGPGDPVDPTDTATNSNNRWAVVNVGRTSTVTHTYGTNPPYSWTVFLNAGGSVTFCSGSTPVAEATIKSGQGACP